VARLEPLDTNNLTLEQQDALRALLNGPIGAVRGPSEAWLRSPGIANPALRLVEYCRYGTALPHDVAELVILVTGAHWRSQFEFWGHARAARAAGIPPEAIEAIRTGARPQLDRPDLQVAYDLMTEYFATNRVSDATYARATATFAPRELVDLIGVAGLYSLVSMTLNIFEVPVPEGQTPPFAE
jgi:4-carboxymuconolactone decarboxylase